MRQYLLPLTASLLLALGACATTDESASAATAASADATPATASTDASAAGTASTGSETSNSAVSCNAELARKVVGQAASSDVIEQARTAAGAETARTLKPGQAVTMEFNGSRLNLDVDAGNTITNVRCG